MPRSPLTETIRRVDGMITYVRENLSTEEYMLFLDLLAPEPEPAKKPQKKSSKKAVGGGGRLSSRSAKASGIAKTLNDNLSQRRREAMEDITGESEEPPRRCTATIDDGIKRVCTQFADANIHHLRTDPNYHEFESAATSAAGSGG